LGHARIGEIAIDPTNNLEMPAVRGRRDRIEPPEVAHEMLAALPASEKAAGHGDVRQTWNRYGHLLPGGEEEAAARLDAFLQPTEQPHLEAVPEPPTTATKRQRAKRPFKRDRRSDCGAPPPERRNPRGYGGF
jgi:hypothetical protein